eukprot:sb/3471128/
MQLKWVVLVVVVGILAVKFRRSGDHIVLPTVTTGDNDSFNFTVLGTNDLHSTFRGLGLVSYPDSIKGGYSRLVHLIRSTRKTLEEAGELVLTVDAGDWYSGSLFDNIAADPRTPSIPQLEFFAAARYDAIIFGNHDFDRYESALFTMLQKAESLHLDLTVLTSNLLPCPMAANSCSSKPRNSHVNSRNTL